jgi:hypothetical protein
MPSDPNKIFPPLPKGFSLPFYYASVNAIWVYYKVSAEKVAPYLQDIALAPALFDGQALVLLHFQRYTGFISSALSVVNEVQLNIIAYPSVLAAQAPAISFADFLAGGEQTKTLGAYRLYVPADNPFAVQAGKELFNEPTFLTTFTYAVPDMNDPSQKSWVVTCNDPDKTKNQTIFTLKIDANPPDLVLSAMSPIMQYTRDPKGPHLRIHMECVRRICERHSRPRSGAHHWPEPTSNAGRDARIASWNTGSRHANV